MKALSIFLVVASAILSTYHAQATFNLSLRTTASDVSDSGAARLYNGPGTSDPSESSDTLWFVIDLDGDGIFKPGALSGLSYNGTLGGLISSMLDPDDYLYQTTLNNALQGRTLQVVPSIPSNAQSGGTGSGDNGGVVKPGYAIVFDDPNLTNGGTFGFDQVVYGLGAAGNVIPQSGNLNARIGQDTFASTYTFSVGGSTPPPPQPVISNIVAQVTSSNLVFRFAFTTASGASYQVQSSTNLAPPVVWANEAGAISGSGSVTNVSITNGAPLIPQKFFRVLAN